MPVEKDELIIQEGEKSVINRVRFWGRWRMCRGPEGSGRELDLVKESRLDPHKGGACVFGSRKVRKFPMVFSLFSVMYKGSHLLRERSKKFEEK